jgi:hypothetical protein
MQAKRDLEVQVRSLLEEIGDDTSMMTVVVSSPQILLSEEINTLRHLQSQLAEFKQKMKDEPPVERVQ